MALDSEIPAVVRAVDRRGGRHELAKLRALIVKAKKQGDLRTWRRDKAVRD